MSDFSYNLKLIYHNIKSRKALRSVLFVAILLYVLTEVAAVLYAYYLGNQYPILNSVRDLLFLLLRGLVISLFISIIVSSLDKVNQEKVSKLKKLFKSEEYNKTSIVVPDFDYQYFNELFTKKGGQFPADFDNSRRFISKSDFFVANNIISLFQSVGLNMPEVISDTKALAELEQPSLNPKRTFILVGLYSNLISERIFSDPKICEKLKFKLGPRDDASQRSIQVYLNNKATETRKVSGLIADFGIFARLKYQFNANKKCNVIIIGGLNATGTEAIADFIYSNWENHLFDHLIEKSKNENRSVNKVEAFSAICVVTKDKADIDTVSYINESVSIDTENIIYK